MTAAEKRIWIAERCGWTDIHTDMNGLIGNCPDGGRNFPIPDYLNSLDACHEFVFMLWGETIFKYIDQLQMIVLKNERPNPTAPNESVFHLCIHASPIHRCDAFVVVMGGQP